VLEVSGHAVDRFIERWRPGVPIKEAEVELRSLAENAAPTKRRTILKDANIYLTIGESGERIPLVVRDRTVITVLPARGEAEQDFDLTPNEELINESIDTVAACRAMALSNVRDEKERLLLESRKMNAAKLIRDWHEFMASPSEAKLQKAHDLLGIPFKKNSRGKK